MLYRLLVGIDQVIEKYAKNEKYKYLFIPWLCFLSVRRRQFITLCVGLKWFVKLGNFDEFNLKSYPPNQRKNIL